MPQTRRQRREARETQQRLAQHVLRLKVAQLRRLLSQAQAQHAAERARLQQAADNANMSVFQHPHHWTFAKVACGEMVPCAALMREHPTREAVMDSIKAGLASQIAQHLLRQDAFTVVQTTDSRRGAERVDMMLMVGKRGDAIQFSPHDEYPPGDLKW